MKKLLLSIVLLFTITAVSAQTDYYTCYSAKLYSRASSEDSWQVIDENDDVKIKIAVTKNVIQINAQSATTFKINGTDYKDFDNSSVSGRRYSAYEVVNQRNCYLDLVKYKEEDILVLSIIYLDKATQINLRYYIVKD